MTFVLYGRGIIGIIVTKKGKVANRRKLDGRMKEGWHMAFSDSRQEEHWAGHGNGVTGVKV